MITLERSVLGMAVLGFALLGVSAYADEHEDPIPLEAGAYIEVSGFDDGIETCGEQAGTAEDPVVCPSLRSAVLYVNANPDPNVYHTIFLSAGTYVLDIPGVDEGWSGTFPDFALDVSADASVGDLDITQSVHIIGAGPGQTVIRWNQPPAMDEDPDTGDRIFHIQTTDQNIAEVVIEGLTVMHGEVGLVPSTDCDAVTNDYDLDVRPGEVCEITQFRRMGGSIAVGLGAAIVEFSQEVHGGGQGGGGGSGGGGSEDGGPFPGGKPGEEEGFDIGRVVLRNVVVADSWSGADGGGLYNAAPVELENVWITGNVAEGGNGGGIYNDSPLTMTNTTIGRFFDVDTIAALLGDDLNVDLEAIGNTGNRGENGGGVFATGGAQAVVNVVQGAINGNVAVGGGGIAARAQTTVVLENTTVSANEASDVGAGVISNGAVQLTNATIADNIAGGGPPAGGSGLNSFGGGTFTFVNTLLSGNLKYSEEAEGDPILAACGCTAGLGGGEDDGACQFRFTSLGYNMEDSNTCQLVWTGDQPLTVAAIEPLGFNNVNLPGLTETHALPSSSPAVNAGLNLACPDLDQRGVVRPQGASCDIGAFELAVTPSRSGGGGGGCTLGGRGVTDPLLPGLVLLALAWLGMRRFTRGRRGT